VQAVSKCLMLSDAPRRGCGPVSRRLCCHLRRNICLSDSRAASTSYRSLRSRNDPSWTIPPIGWPRFFVHLAKPSTWFWIAIRGYNSHPLSRRNHSIQWIVGAPALCRFHCIQSLRFPSFRENTVDYQIHLPPSLPFKAVFKGTVARSGDKTKYDFVIKFTLTYCEEAHQNLAEMGRAPFLRFCERVKTSECTS